MDANAILLKYARFFDSRSRVNKKGSSILCGIILCNMMKVGLSHNGDICKPAETEIR